MSTSRNWLFLSLLLFLFATPVQARDWQEIAAETQAAQANIAAAQKLISQSENKAQEALDKVRNAEHFEGPQWGDLERAMKDYNETFRQQMGVIDVNVKQMLQVNPAAQVPTVDTNPPQFKASVKALEAIRDDIKATIIKAKKFKAARMLDDAKVRGEMLDRTEQQYYDTALNLAGIPLNSDGSINYGDIIAGCLPGPAGLINTGLNLTFGLYYYADEMKSGVRQIKTFKQMMAYADEAIVKAEADKMSAEQGLGYLNGYWQQKEDLMRDFYKVRNGWSSTADQSRKEQKEEQTKEFEQELEKPKYTKEIGHYEPPLMASEFEPEAKSAIRELESTALAAMQGGDPDAFAEAVARYYRKYADQQEQARKAVTQAQEAANKAWQTYYAATQAAGQAYSATIRGHCSCEREFLDAAYRAYLAACQSAYNTYLPFAKALLAKQREQTRISMAVSMIANGADQLGSQMYSYAHTANNALLLKQVQARESLEEATSDLGALSNAIPDRWTLDSIKNYINGMDERIAHDIYWGANAYSLQSQLQGYADSIRATGERARRAIPEYTKAASQASQVANMMQMELNEALNKDALIIGSFHDGSLQYMRWPWWGGEPWQRSGDRRQEYLDSMKKYFGEMLKFYERDDISAAGSFNYEGLARQLEQKAEEFGAVVDRVNTFNYRLAGVTGRLDKLSKKLTNQGLYQGRPKAAAMLASEELNSGSWAGLTTSVENILQQFESLKQPGYPYFVSGYVGVRPRMLAAQNILYVASMNKMRNFINQHDRGWFAPVPPKDFKLLEDAWKQLEPLYDRFDSLASSERTALETTQKDFPDTAGVAAAYSAIPSQFRGMVSGAYQAFQQENTYLHGYVTTKLEALQPLTDTTKNNVLGHLRDWIGGYPAAYEAWQTEQARLQKEAEQRQRQYEEQKKKQAQNNLAAAQAIYPAFTAAYQGRNVSAVLALLSSDWQADGGSDRYDLEETLSNSFRIFDTVTFTITGLNIQQLSETVFQAKYSVRLTGTINRQNIKHEEKSDVTDTVTITPDGARITHTSGGSFVIR